MLVNLEALQKDRLEETGAEGSQAQGGQRDKLKSSAVTEVSKSSAKMSL